MDVRSKKKKARRILRPDERQKSKETIPVNLPASERFYAGLLRSEPVDFLGESRGLLKTICDRLALVAPTRPLASSYSTQQDHFSYRAALVLDEARHELSDSIRLLREDFSSDENRKNRRNATSGKSNKNLSSLLMTLNKVEHTLSGHSILTFSKKSVPFTKDEIFNLRHGTIVACLDRKKSRTIENILLGVVLPQHRDEMMKLNSFAVMLFRKIKKTNEGIWKLMPFLSLLSEQRKFEACIQQMVTPVPFLLPLLGRKKDQLDENSTDGCSDCKVLDTSNSKLALRIPRLNDMQEKAATAFLKSKSNTICLVQGPPGTGKTTLLTSVISRYIIDSRKLEHTKRRLMVCAPTNKAITVLCSRFLNSFFDNESYPCNVVLVGDEEKLFEYENRSRGMNSSKTFKMREIFLYTCVDAIKDDFLYVRKILDQGKLDLLDKIQTIACRLKNLLKQKAIDDDITANATSIAQLIENFSLSREERYPTEIINKIDVIIDIIGALNRESIWQQLLQTADVIFCTLGSSGSRILKKTICEVDDLVVDEAAAATEPEIYIPFQYLPRRLLVVGDPKQLPAATRSQFAEKMGLSKSLHERLMYDCNYDHIMLDTQYRMKPALSEFPSKNFYGGRLINGRNISDSKDSGEARMMGRSTYTLYQVNGRERPNRWGSIENEAEAKAVVDIVENLRLVSRGISLNWCSADRLRVITFYQAQVLLIQHLLRRRNLGNVFVSTVDSSQGCEADFVIVSFVRSRGTGRRNKVGFVSDDRRLNVALTRAKFQMICVGNIEGMANFSDGEAGSVKHLAIDALNRRCVHPFPSRSRSLSRTFDHDNSQNKFKRRKIDKNNRQGRFGFKASTQNTISDTSSRGSHRKSPVVNSSSCSTNSGRGCSSQAKNCNPDIRISPTKTTILTRFRGAPSSNVIKSKCNAGFNTIDENLPTNEQQNNFGQPTSFSKIKNESPGRLEVSATSRNLEVADSERIQNSEKEKELDAEDTAKSNGNFSSALSKNETMAVFENFSF